MKKILPALVLFLVAVLAYGLLGLRLGFYWDDLPITWIRYTLGSEALTRYFSTNRPVWGLLHQVTTRLIPQVPPIGRSLRSCGAGWARSSCT